MKLIFVISGVWFLHWLCLLPLRFAAIIAAPDLRVQLWNGLYQHSFPGII
jgi:hypothetical protein